jgi:hypothetical protein
MPKENDDGEAKTARATAVCFLCFIVKIKVPKSIQNTPKTPKAHTEQLNNNFVPSAKENFVLHAYPCSS